MVEKPVTGVSVEGVDRVKMGEKVSFHFSVQGLDTLRSVAVLRVTDPNGQQVDHYGGNLDVVDSEGSGAFRLALNDAAGMWELEITDAISGARDTLSVLVE